MRLDDLLAGLTCPCCGHAGDVSAQDVDEFIPVGDDVVIVAVRAGVCAYCHERHFDDAATAVIDAAIATLRDGRGPTLERVGVVYRAAPAAAQEQQPE
jgi:YgiT-type zinc finger domain-containing protein